MRSSRTGSRCWISSASAGATRNRNVPSRRSPRAKVSLIGQHWRASASPTMAGHSWSSCASPSPCLPSTGLAMRGRLAPTATPAPPLQLRQAAALPERLLAWYDRHRRVLPWRALPGAKSDPYRVWLSEIMLQQTTVMAVAPYFTAFLARWPDVAALAAADLEEVLHAWQGLGYYARARNLHACAREIVARHHGKFPGDEAALRALPGIGGYTAAAIAAIAFGRQATAVDGNVERVIARLHAVTTPLPDAKPELHRLAAALTPVGRPGDYAQALMDLGATICTKHRPKCVLCPWRAPCLARRQGIAESLPARRPKAMR